MALGERYGGDLMPYEIEQITNGFVVSDKSTYGNAAGATRLYFHDMMEVWRWVQTEVDKQIEKVIKESRERNK